MKPKFLLFSWLVALLIVLNAPLFSRVVRADEPPLAPANHQVLSRNKKFVAVFDWKAKKTTVYAIQKSKRKTKLWQMSGWHRNAYLADNGRNLIVFYPGANLLNLGYKPNDVMITFYERGKLLRQVRLNEIVPNPTPDKFRRTVSHYSWLESYGLEGDKFIINTLQKKRLVFAVKTGKSVGK